MMRLLIASGASVGAEEMQSLQEALELIERCEGQRRFKDEVENIAGILGSAQEKILNVSIENVCSDSWTVKVHSLDGECVATITDISCSANLGELQKEIGLQASIPPGQQGLLLGSQNIERRSARSLSLREVFILTGEETRESAEF